MLVLPPTQLKQGLEDYLDECNHRFDTGKTQKMARAKVCERDSHRGRHVHSEDQDGSTESALGHCGISLSLGYACLVLALKQIPVCKGLHAHSIQGLSAPLPSYTAQKLIIPMTMGKWGKEKYGSGLLKKVDAFDL